jgi:endonuclease YncB( thermonuclease family)/ubiquinone/menaquinone biosynthesis C-methylase UbiE
MVDRRCARRRHEGRAKPVDGDSFNIEIRIFGIDSPESGQTCKDAGGNNYPCARIASDAMAELLRGKTVRCEKQDQDTKYGRPFAICYADGVDVGAAMVDRGLAVAYRKYSEKYVPNEDLAKAAKRGLWAGTFEMPWDYRARTQGGGTAMPLMSSIRRRAAPMSEVGLSSTLARAVILRAQQTRYKGTTSGHYSVEAFLEQGSGSISFPQADAEAADYESFFRHFQHFLIKDCLRDKEVLDFGSGYGGRTVEYKLCGAKRVCGVEPFENVVMGSQRYAESRGVQDVEFRVCCSKKIPYPDASFDVVISYDVIEHVEDPRASVAEIWRVLRPGGLSLNVFPVYFGARSHHLDYITTLPGLHWLFSARTLVKAVNSILAENPAFAMPLQPEPCRSFDGQRYVLPKLNGLSGWHLKALFKRFEIINLERLPLYWLGPGRGRITDAITRSTFVPTVLRDAATSSVACILRKPGPTDSIPLPQTANSFRIRELNGEDWTLTKPALLTAGRITIRGAVPFPQAYAAVSSAYRLPRGARAAAAGNIRRGGITLGLLNSNDQFATTITIPEGRFHKFIDAPADGIYRIVVANNLSVRQKRNDAEVSEIGLVELDPAEHRAEGPRREIAEVIPLEADAWEVVLPPTRRDGKGLRISGDAAFAMAYAAKSAPYRFPTGALVAAAGTVRQGGIVLGLLDSREQWARTTAIGEGTFRTAIEVHIEGEYRVVIANNLSDGQRRNDVEVTEVGLVGLDPAKYRIKLR